MIDYHEPNSSNQEHFLYIFSGGDVKCILHIGEGQCEGNIKSFLENRNLWEKVCASAQFRLQSKEEKKQETKYDQIINSIPNLLIPSYGDNNACYKNFTAISKPKGKPKASTRSIKISTRSENTSPLLASATGVLPPLCIFCNRGRKKIGGSWKEPGKNEKHETEIAIRNKAKMFNDKSKILKVGNCNFGEGPDFVAKEVHYHHECKRN